MPPDSTGLFHGVRNVFLDRDGVINRKAPEGQYVTRWQDFEILPGVVEAIVKLNAADLMTFMVTNQRGIALGLYTRGDLLNIHGELQQLLSAHHAHIDAIYYCPHDKIGCECRKPRPGMLQEAFRQYPQAAPENSVLIGDSLSDIECGTSLSMRTIFISSGDPNLQKPGAAMAAGRATAVSNSLLHAVTEHLGIR